MKNLIYTGGIYHEFPQMAQALAEVLSGAGIASTISFDIDDCARQLEAGGIDLFTVYALRWRMLDGEKYAALRPEWALAVAPATRRIIENHVRKGGGLLALHTAVICFDDWAEWQEMLGGAWVWGQSSHPPLQATTVRIAEPKHVVTLGLDGFNLHDEVYRGMTLGDDINVLATASTLDDTQQHPVAWTHRHGAGRVLCDTLGHDASCIRQPVHAEMLRRAARWTAGIE